MTMKLGSADFPLIAMGNRIYAKSQSSPILTAPDFETAADITLRLNRDDQAYGHAPVHHRPEPREWR